MIRQIQWGNFQGKCPFCGNEMRFEREVREEIEEIVIPWVNEKGVTNMDVFTFSCDLCGAMMVSPSRFGWRSRHPMIITEVTE